MVAGVKPTYNTSATALQMANSIKIWIADVGDSSYDSNLLIAGNSVQTQVVALDDQVTMQDSDGKVLQSDIGFVIVETIPCYVAGTMIETADGPRAVEDLVRKPGCGGMPEIRCH